MYTVKATVTFEDDLKRLSQNIIKRVIQKIDQLAEHPEMARFALKNMPKDLIGLHKYRIGDYRLLFWIDHAEKRLVLYRVMHRREVYNRL